MGAADRGCTMSTQPQQPPQEQMQPRMKAKQEEQMNFYTNKFPITGAFSIKDDEITPLKEPIKEGTVFKIKYIAMCDIDLVSINGKQFVSVPVDVLRFGFTETENIPG
ncbi:MAG: hypothetical protein KAR40_11075 [Candidatus Sabulitectum sp.]|nr:hypothetical protein [Candidatus Sabulitectum sp.]